MQCLLNVLVSAIVGSHLKLTVPFTTVGLFQLSIGPSNLVKVIPIIVLKRTNEFQVIEFCFNDLNCSLLPESERLS